MGVDPVVVTENAAACPAVTVWPMGCAVIEGAIRAAFTWFAVTAVGISAPIAANSAVTTATCRVFGLIFAVTRISGPLTCVPVAQTATGSQDVSGEKKGAPKQTKANAMEKLKPTGRQSRKRG
jgi:hypothetical protein